MLSLEALSDKYVWKIWSYTRSVTCVSKEDLPQLNLVTSGMIQRTKWGIGVIGEEIYSPTSAFDKVLSMAHRLQFYELCSKNIVAWNHDPYTTLPSGSSTWTVRSIFVARRSRAQSRIASKSRHVCVTPVVGRTCWYFGYHAKGIGVISLVHIRLCRSESMQWSICFMDTMSSSSIGPWLVSFQKMRLRSWFLMVKSVRQGWVCSKQSDLLRNEADGTHLGLQRSCQDHSGSALSGSPAAQHRS